MGRGDHAKNQGDKPLSKPTRALAARFMRKVSWEDRIEGSIYDPGPGNMVQRLFKLEEVYNLLKSMPSFEMDFEVLKSWIGRTIGDKELARKIESVLAGGCENEREEIVYLLGIRLGQCKEVLERQTSYG